MEAFSKWPECCMQQIMLAAFADDGIMPVHRFP